MTGMYHTALFGQCDYSNGDDITVSTSGFESGAGFTQTYVLVDADSDSITDIQPSGTFSSVSSGNYEVYAINYEGSTPSSLAIDSLWNSVELFESSPSNCVDILGPKDGTIRVCESICDEDNINVSASGYENKPGYEEIYVLVNQNDSIYSNNNSGSFDKNDYRNTGTVALYAVNTNDMDVMNEIDDGGLWSDIEAMELSTCTDHINARYIQINACAVLQAGFTIEGHQNENNNFLKWDASTINADHYKVYKSVNTPDDFIEIGEVSDPRSDGLFEFKDIYPGENDFYKVTAYIQSGKRNSNIINLNRSIKDLKLLKLFPNPAKRLISIHLKSPGNQNVNIIISDFQGRIVESKFEELNAGVNKLDLNLENLNLTSGIYNYTIVSSRKTISTKFIKQD